MTFNHGVPGSNPGCLIFANERVLKAETFELNPQISGLRIKYYADVAELADALDLGSSPRGCRFNSCHPH